MLHLEELERRSAHFRGITERYRREASVALASIEKQRKRAAAIMFWSVLPVGLALALMGYERHLGQSAQVISVLLLFAGIAMATWGWVERRATRRRAKVGLATLICDIFGFRYTEKPSRQMVHALGKLGLVAVYEAFEVEDEIQGEVDGIRFLFQEAALAVMKETFGYGEMPFRRTEDTFHGLIGGIKCPFPFEGTTVATYRKGPLEHATEPPFPGHRLESGDAAFDRVFEIYATDDRGAAQVLDAAMRSAALKLNDFFTNDIAFAFDNGWFWFVAHDQAEWMETRGGVKELSDERYASYIAFDVTLIHHMIEVLGWNGDTHT